MVKKCVPGDISRNSELSKTKNTSKPILVRWDCHEHRDELKISDACTIYHPERGQLCYGERHWDCVLFFPLVFKSKQQANEWIEKGYIAQLQESLGILNVGFHRECCTPMYDYWIG